MTVAYYANNVYLCSAYPHTHGAQSDGEGKCNVCDARLENYNLSCTENASHVGFAFGGLNTVICYECGAPLFAKEEILVSLQGRIGTATSPKGKFGVADQSNATEYP
jgi:hypothetical protein